MNRRACLVCGFSLVGWPGGTKVCSESCRLDHSRARDRARNLARREEKRRYRAKHRERILEAARVHYRDYYPKRKAEIQARRRARRLEIAAALQEFNSFVGTNHKPSRAKPLPARVPSKGWSVHYQRYRATYRRRYAENRERILEAARQRYAENPERGREMAAQSRLRNREAINARKRQWRKANLDRRREEKRREYGKYRLQIRARSRVLELEKSALVHAFRELELI